MVRGIQVVVGLGLAGLLLVLGYGLLGEPRSGRVANRAGSRPANPAPVAPKAVVEAGSQVPQAMEAQPGLK
jgi:hypothetical protein